MYDKPNSIEELAEQREYMKQIPEQLKKNQELIDKAMIDYELIEEFNYNISAEDFNAKWVVINECIFLEMNCTGQSENVCP